MEDHMDKVSDSKISQKMKLSSLWVVLMVLYIYCDFLSLYRPGQIEKINNGLMGFMEVNQFSLIIASLLMIIPTIMIFLSLVLNRKVNIIVNICVAIVYILINGSNMIGESWGYYFLFGVIEILTTILILIISIKWPIEGK
jgi:hypothetical protein